MHREAALCEMNASHSLSPAAPQHFSDENSRLVCLIDSVARVY